ncbi:hypothetical protein FRX31_023918 [Thalictrum thalictroides]|uniref:Uncharacterized protein n=1 Tax=Thalictrum thalictroides TaxID=46969 RepID=A0A7J6VQK6_THATH|nr:hypothetical protein FRX31_023918 [Thalictrum thalictroides]
MVNITVQIAHVDPFERDVLIARVFARRTWPHGCGRVDRELGGAPLDEELVEEDVPVAKKGKDVVIVKEDKVKLTMEGKVKMVFEENVDDVCKVIVKLGLN